MFSLCCARFTSCPAHDSVSVKVNEQVRTNRWDTEKKKSSRSPQFYEKKATTENVKRCDAQQIWHIVSQEITCKEHRKICTTSGTSPSEPFTCDTDIYYIFLCVRKLWAFAATNKVCSENSLFINLYKCTIEEAAQLRGTSSIICLAATYGAAAPRLLSSRKNPSRRKISEK